MKTFREVFILEVMSMSSIEQFDIGGFPNEYSTSMDFGSVAGGNIIATQTRVHGAED